MTLSIRSADSKSELKKFIDFPHDLYEGDAHYVPELFIAQKDLFNPKKHPFHKHGTVKTFLAYEGNKIVGRIAAIKNPTYNDYHKSNIGFFGFYDYIESKEVATALLNRVIEELASEGYESLMGPVNFSTNETAGTLVDGFDKSPQIMMTYNKPYYDKVQKSIGMEKEMDLFAYEIPTKSVSDKSIKLSKLIEERLKRQGITIRNMNIKKLKQEVPGLFKIYNSAWENNWGFVPMSRPEIEHMANELKLIADPEFSYIAEHNGEAVGFSVSLPNINEITKSFKKGRLLPFNIFRLLLGKKKVKTVRIITTGVTEAYRKKGIEAIFFAKNILEARKRNLDGGEASWILESNAEMVTAAEKLNGNRYKTYRLYNYKL